MWTMESKIDSITAGSKKAQGIPYQDIVAMLDRVVDERFDVKQQAAFLQVRGPNNHRLYVALQENVRRIDLAFEPPSMDGIIKARKQAGAVEWELDTADPSALSRLEQLIQWMKDAPPLPVKKKTAFVPQLPAIAQKRRSPEDQASAARDDDEELQARRDRITKFAKERGMEISPNAKI